MAERLEKDIFVRTHLHTARIVERIGVNIRCQFSVRKYNTHILAKKFCEFAYNRLECELWVWQSVRPT